MPKFQNSSKSGSGPHYVWEYEYYDDDEPVSFDNLTAHRCMSCDSVVIGFWVGLALFVIFMFFVLTLLTKTGPPHQENQDTFDRHCRPSSCMVDFRHPQAPDNKACSQPLLDESHSLIHCFIHEEEAGRTAEGHGQWRDAKQCVCSGSQQAQAKCKVERDTSFLTHCNIPNFVNSEYSSALGDDDLLLCDQPVLLDSNSPSSNNYHHTM
ncbi:melanocortin-2 receptor accessory protein 2A-like isoform X1 [Brienomyrus brachyistius]|uniref:melanocortin-2 receptor accessory protein 2A-like isoform X1 n=1 Tax=Brienomyrus brachyistius TaxID=42636 RepID=UPI0020B40EED|nr:melanocortin-2 receptor accessory protein 2A-like isoform X1 [Brienomyrus brachyistius]XP_048841542.1 melanocortin-2 receptor accessory protein 2A-like isoform X1 [Brienomyrus brachyistius]